MTLGRKNTWSSISNMPMIGTEEKSVYFYFRSLYNFKSYLLFRIQHWIARLRLGLLCGIRRYVDLHRRSDGFRVPVYSR